MNPYVSRNIGDGEQLCEWNQAGTCLLSIGWISLMPAALFSALVLFGTLGHLYEEGFTVPPKMYWPVGLALSLVGFLVSSAFMQKLRARYLTYVLAASTVFCAVIFDTRNVVAMNAYSEEGGQCGLPIMAGLLIRCMCFSTFAGVAAIVLAGVFGRWIRPLVPDRLTACNESHYESRHGEANE